MDLSLFCLKSYQHLVVLTTHPSSSSSYILGMHVSDLSRASCSQCTSQNTLTPSRVDVVLFGSKLFRARCLACRSMHIGCEETCRFHSGVSDLCMANAEVCRCGDTQRRVPYYWSGGRENRPNLDHACRLLPKRTLQGPMQGSASVLARQHLLGLAFHPQRRLQPSSRYSMLCLPTFLQQNVLQHFLQLYVMTAFGRRGATVTPVSHAVRRLLTPVNSARTFARGYLSSGFSPQ